jgi:glycosyltransferase involved in cell wall biosynthesis
MLLSVVLIAYNEENTIARCLQSVQGIADEIVVVDSCSTDKTVEICQTYNARVIQHPFEGFGLQKKFASSQATHEYVLSLDADEEVSETLKKSILLAKADFKGEVYSFNRRNFYCNKPIRFCGWYPDVQVRLFNRKRAVWNEKMVHETIVFHSKIQHLKGDLNHYTCQTIEEHRLKEKKYALLNAEALANKKTSIHVLTPWLKRYFRFLKIYFFQGGFLDGYYGFVISKTLATSSFLKYSVARKKRREVRQSKVNNE